jgi:hypothetical protein
LGKIGKGDIMDTTLANKVNEISFIKGWIENDLYGICSCNKNIKKEKNELDFTITYSKEWEGKSEPYSVHISVTIPDPENSNSFSDIHSAQHGDPLFYTLEASIKYIEDFVTIVGMSK